MEFFEYLNFSDILYLNNNNKIQSNVNKVLCQWCLSLQGLREHERATCESEGWAQQQIQLESGFHVLHWKHLLRRGGFRIQTRVVYTQYQLCETALEPQQGTVNMLVQQD